MAHPPILCTSPSVAPSNLDLVKCRIVQFYFTKWRIVHLSTSTWVLLQSESEDG